MQELARRLMNDGSLLLFGRGYNYATALEGALKVKEVALMHRRVYTLGRANPCKHGSTDSSKLAALHDPSARKLAVVPSRHMQADPAWPYHPDARAVPDCCCHAIPDLRCICLALHGFTSLLFGSVAHAQLLAAPPVSRKPVYGGGAARYLAWAMCAKH